MTRLALALLLWLATGAISAAAHAEATVTVAVLYFDYNGDADEMSFLRKGMTEMLASDLVDIPGITVVERLKLEEVLKEIDLNQTKRIDRSSALRVGKLLGARYLVVGSYTIYKENMIVSLRVLEVETGKVVIGRQNHKGNLDDFYDLEQNIAATLRDIMQDRLQPTKVSGDDKGGSNSSTTSSRKKSGSKTNRKTNRKTNTDSSSSEVGVATAVGGPETSKRTRPGKPKKLHARTAARYGKALDAADRGDKKTARAELAAIVKEQPDFELAAVDLASLAQ